MDICCRDNKTEHTLRLTQLNARSPPTVSVDATAELDYFAASRLRSPPASLRSPQQDPESKLGQSICTGVEEGWEEGKDEEEVDAGGADGQGKTLPAQTVMRGCGDVVEMLLERGIDIVAEEDDWPSLHLAAWYGHEAVIRLILDRGVGAAPTPAWRKRTAGRRCTWRLRADTRVSRGCCWTSGPTPRPRQRPARHRYTLQPQTGTLLSRSCF
ncbi:hypothetical protein B0T24DRAFT_422013 [Lasiosphaeria ovina]|uniref:Ankyrin repeat protein n=1 Tax=Lasiosphaeria ovina TaxID=92902 RepID=A0AAE0JVF9_9PEZI|nr:hypothetical protein B0T24DRAFT_422013 [Lasiosphaeria ovina]